MRSLTSLALLAALPTLAFAGRAPYFAVLSDKAGSWPAVLGSVGFQARPADQAGIVVIPRGGSAPADISSRVERGAVAVIEGDSHAAALFGFRKGADRVRVGSIRDIQQPDLPIIWEKPVELPVFELPERATVFAKERWTGAPVVAGFRSGAGAVLWVAADPGVQGYERFPYLLNALHALGVDPPFSTSRLWAFFDSSYRLRVDPDYFAVRWRKSGISSLHVAAWHYYEPDPESDRYLQKLIEACHREAITVYAWLELPHVSEKFWADHPEWREQTAMLQDAQLDWRKLMNLTNRDCFRSVSEGVRQLIERFDWDGVNLAELYFESLEGVSNPSRFTPMNADVRAAFRARKGFDPLEIFGRRNNETSKRAFLDFRAELARNMQMEWLEQMEQARRSNPDLDIVLTHVDDRFDSNMRDAIGADAARVLPLLDRNSFTFLVEDPATVWNLGPQRYATLANRYAELTEHVERLAIDLNIVERYQDVYPTKQQTGSELFELVHSASKSFARVALYFENSLRAPDLALLSSAAANVTWIDYAGSRVTIESLSGVGLPVEGGAVLVDGKPWPVHDTSVVWLPPGRHIVEATSSQNEPGITHLNADLQAARLTGRRSIEVSYKSASRALAILSAPPRRVLVNGKVAPLRLAGPRTLFLPSGRNTVEITFE